MKRLRHHAFDAAQARIEWQELEALLISKSVLKETKDVLPFFGNRPNLSLLIANYFPDLKRADVLAHEFAIAGDFRVDLIVGDSTSGNFLLVEFEDGAADSLFKTGPGRTSSIWARRYESAFSQIIDWFWKLEDMRSTSNFQTVFGNRDVRFQGLIVAGKNMGLSAEDRSRLRWRTEKVVVDSKRISCVSFDELLIDFDFWLSKYNAV